MKRRTPSDEEQRLWQTATQHDVPFTPSRKVAESPPPAGGRVREGASPAFRTQNQPPPQPSPLQGEGEVLQAGAYAGIDRNTAERFRKGKYAIDATLDLHGMTREKAYQALVDFLSAHYDRGSRCLLVITGKSEPGVLKGLLPRWLGEPAIRPMILAFDAAAQKHGGGGAFYVLLKRRRN